MEQNSNYKDPNEEGISDDERGQRLHRFMRDEAAFEQDYSSMKYPVPKAKKETRPMLGKKFHKPKNRRI